MNIAANFFNATVSSLPTYSKVTGGAGLLMASVSCLAASIILSIEELLGILLFSGKFFTLCGVLIPLVLLMRTL